MRSAFAFKANGRERRHGIDDSSECLGDRVGLRRGGINVNGLIRGRETHTTVYPTRTGAANITDEVGARGFDHDRRGRRAEAHRFDLVFVYPAGQRDALVTQPLTYGRETRDTASPVES